MKKKRVKFKEKNSLNIKMLFYGVIFQEVIEK